MIQNILNKSITKEMIAERKAMVKDIRKVRKERQQLKKAMKKVFTDLKKAVKARRSRIRAMNKDKKAMKKVFTALKKAVRARAIRMGKACEKALRTRNNRKKLMKKVLVELRKALRAQAAHNKDKKGVHKKHQIVQKQLVNKFKAIHKVRAKYYLKENYTHNGMIIRICMNRKEHMKLFRAMKDYLKENNQKKRMAKKVAKEAKKMYKSKTNACK